MLVNDPGELLSRAASRFNVATWSSWATAARREAANELAVRAVTRAQAEQAQGDMGGARWLVGEIAAHADPADVEQAEAYCRQALALAEELGMGPLAAHCHLGLGTLYRKVGRDEQAQPELATATEMYRAMEMTFWLEQAEDEPGQIGRAR
jgi:tetratricopeptide (TPR) repeat protein